MENKTGLNRGGGGGLVEFVYPNLKQFLPKMWEE